MKFHLDLEKCNDISLHNKKILQTYLTERFEKTIAKGFSEFLFIPISRTHDDLGIKQEYLDFSRIGLPINEPISISTLVRTLQMDLGEKVKVIVKCDSISIDKHGVYILF